MAHAGDVLYHTFSSYEDAEAYITQYEKETSSAYVKWHMRNHGITRLSTLHGHRIWWEDRRGEFKSNTDHTYGSGKKHIQCSKKVECPVCIRMKMIIRFPEYKVNDQASEWHKRTTARRLRNNFSSDLTNQEFQVLLKIDGEHSGHIVGELSGYGLPVHPEVRKTIASLVEDDITSVGEIGRHLERTAVSKDVPASNRRFRPTSNDIRNHVAYNLQRKRFSDDDQKNLVAEVNKWKEDRPEDNIFFRPVGEDADTGRINSMLFLYQSAFQKDLLLRYGKELVLMDSTYNTTQYDIPLVILGVSTNVGFSTVAVFLLSKENKSDIKEALEMLKGWNPDWQPRSFMCDFDHSEISALEQTFEENEHMRHHAFIKDYQREIREQKRKFGFGLNYFTESTIESITEQLIADLLYRVPDKRNPVTSLKSMMVKHVVEHSDLWTLFTEYKMLASQYIVYVLAKEMLILIAAQLGQPYEKCNEQCMETEMDRRRLGF